MEGRKRSDRIKEEGTAQADIGLLGQALTGWGACSWARAVVALGLLCVSHSSPAGAQAGGAPGGGAAVPSQVSPPQP